MKPLLSIVIATKNRVPYCISCIKSILSIQSQDLELIIQDNTDNFELKEYVDVNFVDKRLIYRYTAPPFSSIANFNAALELATGEYVCMIGDDDGINPEIIEATLWAKDNKIDALVGSLSANYRWIGNGAQDTLFTKMTGETLTITHFNGEVDQPDIEDSLFKLMLNGCTNYGGFSLPKFYHGIVRRECFDLIKIRTGAFINGLSPDIYSSVALACVVKNLVTIDYPLTIPGVCGASTSITEGHNKKHSKKLEDAPHFRDRGDYIWSSEVPRLYCVQTIWADSGFAALRDMERLDLIRLFKRIRLYANIIYGDSTRFQMVLNHLKSERNGNRFQVLLDIIKVFITIITGPLYKDLVMRRFLGRLKIILKLERFVILNNITDINKAMIALEKYLTTTGININKELSKIKIHKNIN